MNATTNSNYVWSEERQQMVSKTVAGIEQANREIEAVELAGALNDVTTQAELTDEQVYGDTTITTSSLLPQFEKAITQTSQVVAEKTAKKRGRTASFNPGPTATSITTQLPMADIHELMKRFSTTNKSEALFKAVQELLKK